MSNHQTNTSARRTGLRLGLLALAFLSLVGTVHYITRERIRLAAQTLLLERLSAVLPAEHYNNTISTDVIHVQDPMLGTTAPRRVWRARMDGTPTALIVEATAANGYSGPIELLVAVLKDGTVAGVRVIDHRETPGLGDAIENERSDWILGFDNVSLEAPEVSQWKVKKDGGTFDQFTGATITPRAIVSAVLNTLLFVKQQQAVLYQQATSTVGPPSLP